MTPQEQLVARWKRGAGAKPDLTVRTIWSLAELDAYRRGLSERGALDTDAMAAIRERQDYLQARGMK